MFDSIVPFALGLSLFLYGIITLSGDLQKFAGSKASEYLQKAAANPWSGAFVGMLVTMVIQSSSATTVIVVSLVDAGLLSFVQSLGIMFGANIGTTITAQIVALKATALAPFFIIIGFLLSTFTKGRNRFIGNALFSLGILFLGLDFMGQGIAPIKSDPGIASSLMLLDNPLYALALAAIFTGIVQSSSVTTSLIVLMGMQGLLNIGQAIPMIIGANVGTTVTVMLASTRLGRNSKRAAIGHLMFNALGALLFIPFMGLLAQVAAATAGSTAMQIANAHTIFNVVTAVAALLLIKPFSAMLMRLIPQSEEAEEHRAVHLKEHAGEPFVALELVEKELLRQGKIVLKMLDKGYATMFERNEKKIREVQKLENLVNHLQKEITNALIKSSRRELSKYDAQRVAAYSRMTNEIERVGDLAMHLGGVAQRLIDEDTKFSAHAKKDLEKIHSLSFESFEKAVSLIEKYDRGACDEVVRIEETVDSFMPRLHSAHMGRMCEGLCKPAAGQAYPGVIHILERISDHAKNIAQKTKALEKARKRNGK
ncbi:MAG: Na/Pi cotransporter family protein [Candidatus Diapherotrites archaeon]|nr:Na/Pi cotransporter family protein [Candidatus Diapherotrites archaeon]